MQQMLMIMSMNMSFLLLALGMGYIVYYLAGREEKASRKFGNLIGAMIIAISGVLLLANLYIGAKITAGKLSKISCSKSATIK